MTPLYGLRVLLEQRWVFLEPLESDSSVSGACVASGGLVVASCSTLGSWGAIAEPGSAVRHLDRSNSGAVDLKPSIEDLVGLTHLVKRG